MQKITADREEMKEKLLKLNSLVEQMLTQRNITVQKSPTVVNGESNGVSEQPPQVPSDVNPASKDPAASRETAEQILDLLTEIKTQNTNFLTESMPATCSCCSGQLITV